jgi:4-amino-4-deoxy-L-arabinose transferase-like glycosyltransferase
VTGFLKGRALPAALLPAVILLRMAGILFIGDPGGASWESRIFYSDTGSYLTAAADLEDGTQNEPLYRVPGYPLFMLATRDLAGPGWTATMILQQVVDLLTALLVIAVSTPLIGRSRALWCGVYYLLLPSGVIYSSYLIPDTMLAFLIAASGLFWLRTTPEISPWRGARNGLLGGLCLAAGLLLKPVVLYAPSIYIALVFIPGRPGRLSRALFAAVLTLVCMVVYLPMRMHNQAVFGLPGITTQDAFEPMGRMVLISNYHGMEECGAEFWRFTDSLATLSVVNGRIDYGLRDSLFRAVTWDAIRSDPLRVAWFELSRWPKFFVNLDAHRPYLGITPADIKPPWYTGLSTLIQLPLGLGLLYSLILPSIRRRLDRLFWLGLGWFLFSVPVIGPIASFRYGLLFYWSLVPFTFAAFSELLRRHREATPEAQSIGKKVNP